MFDTDNGIYAEAYRIAEMAHAGCDNDYLQDMAREAAEQHGTTRKAVYELSKRIYMQEFGR